MNFTTSDPIRLAADFESVAGTATETTPLLRLKYARTLLPMFRANYAVSAYYSAGSAHELGLSQATRLEAVLLFALADRISEGQGTITIDPKTLAITVPAETFRNLAPQEKQAAESLRKIVDEVEARASVRHILKDDPGRDFARFEPSSKEHREASFWPRQFAAGATASREQLVTKTLQEILSFYPATERLVAAVDLDRVIAIGSCFARNLAFRLEERGYRGTSLLLPEALNSPRAVLGFLRKLLGESSEINDFVEATLGPEETRQVLGGIKSASCIVLTVGVAVLTLNRLTGALYLGENVLAKIREGELVQHVCSVPEILETLRQILASFRRLNPACRIVLTVSPVPLTGVSTELGHVVDVDFQSKATIKLAMRSLLRESNDAQLGYWPSFEVTKWLAPHVPPELNYRVFGGDDNNSRHVGVWIVREIVDSFIAMAQPAAAAAP